MTEVRYDKLPNGTLQLHVKGHACSADYGQDIVCAAVSALTQCLWANLMRYEDDRWIVYQSVDTKPGEMLLKARPYEAHRQEVEAVFDATHYGLGIIADNYPDNVIVSPCIA